MLENCKREELIPYLFKAKKWSGNKQTWAVWNDMLAEFSDDVVEVVIKRALETSGHIDSTLLHTWAKIHDNLWKADQRMKVDHKKVLFAFCPWCLENREWETRYEKNYCKTCANVWDKDKSEKAKTLFSAGKLDYVKKQRDVVLSKPFDYKAQQVYLNAMAKFKEKHEYII